MTNHLSDEQMILYYYGESGQESLVEDHLASCGSCRSEYQKLQRTLALVAAEPVPQRSSDYGSQVWRRLQSDVRRPTSDVNNKRRRRTLDVGRWTPLAWAGVFAAIVLAAFLLGRHWQHPQPPAVVEESRPVSPQARERVYLSAMADHLEEAELVLTEIANAPEGGDVDIATSQDLARDALKANRIYRQAAARSGEPGLASILDDLEVILVEIVHSPSNVSSAQVDDMRLRIQAQEILFKLKVLASQLRERQKDAARELSRRSS
jgi:hypothetical protein